MRVFSTFTGIGGFELGIIQANENLQNISRPTKRKHEAKNPARMGSRGLDAHNESGERLGDISFVGYSEIDKYAIQIYQSHFPEHKNYGDIKKINEKKLPDFDLLVGGFPCQSFSIAGKRGGFADTRGTLFFELARIIGHKRPRHLLLENVKGLLSHDKGKTFLTILNTLNELGYDCQWQVLNSKHFGVPQNRERVLIVGHLRGQPRPEVFPLGQDSEPDIVLPTLTARYYGAQANGGYIGGEQTKVGTLRTFKDGEGFREIKEGIVPTLPARAREDGSGQAVIFVPEATKMGDMRIRRLTPLECERLQGFPDGWTTGGGTSDTQRYKCLGNAVTVNVIQAVMEKLLAYSK